MVPNESSITDNWRRRFFNFVDVFSLFLNYPPWKRAGPFIWKNLNPLYPRMLRAKFSWNWLSGPGEKDFIILSMYFHYFVIISPWKRAGSFIWTNLNPLHPRMLCAKFGWNWPSQAQTGPFIWSWTNLGPLHQRMLCVKFSWNWSSGSWEEDY